MIVTRTFYKFIEGIYRTINDEIEYGCHISHDIHVMISKVNVKNYIRFGGFYNRILFDANIVNHDFLIGMDLLLQWDCKITFFFVH